MPARYTTARSDGGNTAGKYDLCTMDQQDVLINKVASSGLITIDFEEWIEALSWAKWDIAEALEDGILLREKSFRAYIKTVELPECDALHLTCSADAIIPTWAWMLCASKATEAGITVYTGTETEALTQYVLQYIAALPTEVYAGQRLVVKGCGKLNLPEAVHVAFQQKFQAVAQSILFGEPCSTVPVYKQPRQTLQR